MQLATRSRKATTAVLLSIPILLACFLRLHLLGYFSLWLDETIQYSGTVIGWTEIPMHAVPDQMPLSLYIAKAVNCLPFDQSALFLRLSSAVAGIFLVYTVYLLGRALSTTTTGLISALLVALCPALIHYSQEYRPYGFFSLFSVLSALFYVKGIERPRIKTGAPFVAACTATLYVHFMGIFPVLSIFVHGITLSAVGLIFAGNDGLKRDHRNKLLFLVCSGFSVAILYLPSIFLWQRFLEYMHQSNRLNSPQGIAFDLRSLFAVFGSGLEISGDVAAVLGCCAILGLMHLFSSRPKSGYFLGVWILVPFTVLALKAADATVLFNRYWTFVYPIYMILVGDGLAWLSHYLRRIVPGGFGRGIPASVLAFVAVAFILTPSTVGYFEKNRKGVPADLNSAYASFLRLSKPTDLLLEGSTRGGGSSYWFSFYDSYFLRPAVYDESRKKGIIDALNFPNQMKIERTGMRRVWFLITLTDAEVDRVAHDRQRDFTVNCYSRICLVTIRDAAPMSVGAQVEHFIKTFDDIDLESHAEALSAVRAQ